MFHLLVSFLILFMPVGNSYAEKQTAPDCQLTFRGDSAQRKISQFKNKVVLIDFWASWCGPCAQSFSFLNALHKQYGDKGLQVIGVNLDEEGDKGEVFLATHPANFPIAIADNTQCAKDFAVRAMPMSYIIDRNGSIHSEKLGFRQGETEQTRLLIEQLLEEKNN